MDEPPKNRRWSADESEFVSFFRRKSSKLTTYLLRVLLWIVSLGPWCTNSSLTVDYLLSSLICSGVYDSLRGTTHSGAPLDLHTFDGFFLLAFATANRNPEVTIARRLFQYKLLFVFWAVCCLHSWQGCKNGGRWRRLMRLPYQRTLVSLKVPLVYGGVLFTVLAGRVEYNASCFNLDR